VNMILTRLKMYQTGQQKATGNRRVKRMEQTGGNTPGKKKIEGQERENQKASTKRQENGGRLVDSFTKTTVDRKGYEVLRNTSGKKPHSQTDRKERCTQRGA